MINADFLLTLPLDQIFYDDRYGYEELQYQKQFRLLILGIHPHSIHKNQTFETSKPKSNKHQVKNV